MVGHNAAVQAEIARLFADLRAADAEPRVPTGQAADRCPQDFASAFEQAVDQAGGIWRESWGLGSFRLIDGLLVVRQTAAVHGKIPALLATFRESAGAATPP